MEMQSAYEHLDDSEQLYEELRSDAERLCSPAVDALIWPWADKGSFSSIKDERDLNGYLNSCSTSRIGIFVIKQENTLGPLLISLQHLQRLLAVYHVFSPFISTIRAFGRNGSDEHYSGHHDRNSALISEICYNIRYPALHGRRQSGPPWSMRHMAVYQRYDIDTLKSRLIFIGPSKNVQKRLERIIRVAGALETNRALPHVVVLEDAEAGWEAYLKYLKHQYEETANMARYSRVGTNCKNHKVFQYSADSQGNLISTEVDPPQETFNLSFRDMQKLNVICDKLSTCSTIINSGLEMADGCLEFCERFVETSDIHEASCNKIKLYIRRMRMHARATEFLLKQAEKTAQILSQILNFRNDEETINSSHTMRDTLKALTELGISAKEDSESLRILSEQAQKDARFTKILTFVAMLYLPASLIATIFSSNLLQTVSTGSPIENTKFVPAAQFWVFPALTVILTTATMVPAVIIERLQRKKFISRGRN